MDIWNTKINKDLSFFFENTIEIFKDARYIDEPKEIFDEEYEVENEDDELKINDYDTDKDEENLLINASLDALTDYLLLNWDFSNNSINMIFQVIYYNYIYQKINRKKKLNNIFFTNFVENFKPRDLIHFLSQDKNVINNLFLNYYAIITNENLLEQITENEELLNNIKYNCNSLYTDNVYLINEKYKYTFMDLENYFEICSLSSAEKEHYYINLLTGKSQKFIIPNNYFTSFKEFNNHKAIFIQQLNLDSYIYLECKQSSLGLSNIEIELLDNVSQNIFDNRPSNLPFDNDLNKLMLEIYIEMNNNRLQIIEEFKEQIDDSLKLVKKKINPLSISQYMG